MAIYFTGAATGTNSATMPSHSSGDLLLAFAYRDGSTTAPTLPSGWTNIANSGANANSSRIAYKIAASGSESSGTWTNATSLIIASYKNARVGVYAAGGAASTTVSYSALSGMDASETSWVVGFAGHRSTNTNLQNPPIGMINRANVQDSTDEASLHDTDGVALSWAARSVSVGGTSSGWRSYTVELLDNTSSSSFLTFDGTNFKTSTLRRGTKLYLATLGFGAKYTPQHKLEVSAPGLKLVNAGRTTLTKSVTSKADSSSYYPSASYWNGGDTDAMYWHDRHGNYTYNAMRFVGLDIPQGAKISEAYITTTANNGDTSIDDNDYIIIGAEYVDNASAITSGSDFTSRRTNVATEVTWHLKDLVDTAPDVSPNLATAVQPVVNRAGFGGNLMFFTRNSARNNSQADPQRHSYNSTGTSSYWPRLSVTYHVGSTTTSEFKPTANADTACANSGSIFVSDPLYILDSTSNPIHAICRFPSVNIPQGSTIVSAYFKFMVRYYANSTITNSDYLIVSVDQADDSAQATTNTAVINRYNAAPSGIRWTRVNMGNTGDEGKYFSTTNIGNYVQRVIDRPGWSSGNAISVVWRDSGNSANGLAAYSYQNAGGDTSKIPVLTITYI